MSGEVLHGLSCPRCGGMVPVPEGQALVICPYCEQRSAVSTADGAKEGRGIRRYQVPLRAPREGVENILRRFLSERVQVARDCASKAQVSELFLVHLPFWAVWGRGVAWAFGQVQVGSGDDRRYEPREKRAVTELSWNAPACEVGEFGVQRVALEGRPLEPFDPAGLHRSGMVFEPVGSAAAALEAANNQFTQELKRNTQLDRTEQQFMRITRTRLGLVYYPLWVVRYLYRGRSFQAVVDGFSGEVLYARAPGSVGYRAGALVGGMALGAALAVDVPGLILLSGGSGDGDAPILIALVAFIAGLALMFGAYRIFRHGEHHEYHRLQGASAVPGLALPGGKVELPGSLTLSMTSIEDAVKTLEKFR